MEESRVNANEMKWRTAEGYPEGAMEKVLYKGTDAAPRSILLKIEPGWTMDEHAHVHTELHYVIQGKYESQGIEYPAGSFRMIPKHTNHGPFTTSEGAVVLIVWIESAG
jgi:anti-sigma factor ChrR (cupin superfamily)